MSRLSSRLRSVLALVVTLVVSATVLTPVAADAQDVRTLTVYVTSESAAIVGHNEAISWNVDVTCEAEVGECGNAIIESQLSAGIIVTDIDTTNAPGYVVVNPTEGAAAGQPTVVQLQRAADLLDGETVSFEIRGQVGPDAEQGATVDHLVLVGSTNTPTATAAAAPLVVSNSADWNLQGFATSDATMGRNETHRVAVCGTTEANIAHGDLILDLTLPAGTAIIDAAEGEISATGLRWSIPAISSAELANEHEADVAAGRTPELCHEFFPAVRWAAPDFSLGESVPVALSVTGSAGESVDHMCPAGCRLDAAPMLIASTTVIEAALDGPTSVNAGGIAEWTVEFDASATVEDVQVPLLDITIPAGLQLERLDVSALGDGVEANIHASTDGGGSFVPEPVRTSDTDSSMLDRSRFDSVVGPDLAIDALQIRLISPAGEPVLMAGEQPAFTIVTSPDPLQPPIGAVEMCAQATSANAASVEGRACFVASVRDAGPVFGPSVINVSPAAPTRDQLVTTTLEIPSSSGAPIVDPVVGALLPEGFSFGGLDAITAPEWVNPLPRPIVETIPDYNGTGRTLVLFRWADTDETAASHTIAWTPAEMRAASNFAPLNIELAWRIVAPAGHSAGADLIDVAMTSLITPPVHCPDNATMSEDTLGLGTAFVCGVEAMTDTSSGASLVQNSLVAGVPMLPFVSVDPVQTWCDTTRIDDIDWTSSPCAAPSTPNGRVQFQTALTNTGNRDLTDLWSYGLLPLVNDVGIDPDSWQTPRESAWRASLTGPLVVSGLPWEPVEPGDVLVEYSTATDPCRSELNAAQASWPPSCVDDWTTTPDNWADVTAWRVNVAFDRTPFAGGESLHIEGELLVAADADFDTTAFAAVSHTAFDAIDAAWIHVDADEIAIIVPREDEIIAADPALLPHDLALTAAVNAGESVELHDGPDGGDAVVVDIEVLNQGAPVDSIDVALHLESSLVAEAVSGSVLTENAGSISWSVTPGEPAILTVAGSLGRADSVRIPVPVRIATDWSGEAWSDRPLELVAEISRFDAAGAATALVDHDSVADLDPANDVGPDRAADDGDDVVTGDGQSDTGIEPDPIADDEDDHDVAGIPIWDLAISVDVADGQAPVLAWPDPSATWRVDVVNDGNRTAYGIAVDQRLPAGMTWTLASESADMESGITADENGQVTIAELAPGATATWQATARATDRDVHDFEFAVEIVSFTANAEPDLETDPLVRDWDEIDLASSAMVALPWDIAVGLEHRATTGLPLSLDTDIELQLIVENAGRNVDVVVVDVDLAGAGSIADTPDPSATVVDQLGHPVRVTWDLTDAERPRIQVQRSDGASFGHGARVVVPLHLSVVDPTRDPNTIRIAAALSGFDGIAAPIEGLAMVDVEPANDEAELTVPMWDLALAFLDGSPILRTVDADVVAEWGLRVENQGNRNATDIVIDVDLGDRLTNASDAALIVPFLAPGEHADLVVVSRFVDGYDGRFAASAQIRSMADENRLPRLDADSRPGELAEAGQPVEDDEVRLERELPVAVDLSIAHVATSMLPILPGESSVTFEVALRNVGRPIHDIELLLDSGGFGPVVIDAGDTPYEVTAGAQAGAVVLTLPEDTALMPDGLLTLPVTVRIPENWDGTLPSLTAIAGDDMTTATAPMSVWDLALEVSVGLDSDRVDRSRSTHWDLTVRNEGNRDAHNVVVAVTVPAGMAWNGLAGAVSAADAGATGEIEVTVARIEAGSEATVMLFTDLAATDRSLFRLGAEVVSFDADADPENEADPLAGDIDSTPRATAEARALVAPDDASDQASASVAEDDQDYADAALPADVAVALAIDPATPVQAGASTSWTLSVTNQGLDLAEATLEFDLDDRWVLPEAAALPTATAGGLVLAVTWDLTDPNAPRVSLAGAWPSGTVVELGFELSPAVGASGNETPLRTAVSVIAVDDDGFPATPAPVLEDLDGNAVAAVGLDVFDLALTVRVDPAATLPPAAESTVTFFVDVVNQGSVAATEVSVAIHPAVDAWEPLGETVLQVVDSASPLAPGASVSIPVVLTLAADADLTLANLAAEIATASGTDLDSTPDADPTNDAAPAAAGDPTDDVIDNRDGDEDDHDIADVQPPSWVLGNQVWFDADHDGLRDEDELPAAGVLVALLLDANADGIADDRDLNGAIDAGDRLATTTTDEDGLFRFDDVSAGSYLVAIPPSQFEADGPLAGWSASIQPADAPADGANDGRVRSDGGMTSSTITVAGTAPLNEVPNNAEDLPDERTDLTIDFGLGQWSLGNQVWFDTVENGLFDAAEEEGVPNARLHLFVDANGDGFADDTDADGKLTSVDALATTSADQNGQYRFDGLGAGTYIVAVADLTMRGPLRGWAISRFSRTAMDRDNDSNAAGWSGLHVLSAPIELGNGPTVDLTLDFGFEMAEVAPNVWPDVDLTGFTGPNSFAGGNDSPTQLGAPDLPFFGPGVDDDLTGFEDFGDVDLFEADESADALGASFDFVGEEFFDDDPAGPLAYTGSHSRTLVSWAAMLIVFGAVLVGVSKDPDATD